MSIKILNYFRKNIPIPIFILFFIMIISALFEIVGIGFFIPLLDTQSSSDLVNIINFIFSSIGLQYSTINIAILIVVVFVVKFIFLNIQNFYIYKSSYQFMFNVKKNIMTNLYSMDFVEYNKMGIDVLNNIFVKEIEKSALSIRYFLQIWVNAIYSLAYLFFAMYISFTLVLVSLGVGLVVVVLQRKITKAIIRYSKTVVDYSAKTNLAVLQILNSMKYIKATNRCEYNNINFNKISQDYSNNMEKMSFLNSIPKNMSEFIGVMAISATIIINEIMFHESTVTVVFLGLLLYRTLVKILSIQHSYQDFLINIGSVEVVMNVYNYILKNVEKQSQNDTLQHISTIGSAKMENVFISVDSKVILKDINVEFKKGNSYALVGQSGSGKSTLLNTLTFLYRPLSGQLTINKNSIDNLSFRNKIGYVSQEVIIFDGSIMDNIVFGELFEKEKYDGIVNLLGIDKIRVEKLNMNGTNISGGQRQLIALARELYREPDLLILDEFTSALDSITEKRIISVINGIKKDKIIITVAHRLSSVMGSDLILLMENGEILSCGTFKNLYDQSSKFRSMCNEQSIFMD
ncbi:ATP-binding cassette domain-containing protein [Campylobacter concisus]|jgi:multidrug resistance ABC transporter, ATP-binding/permease protein|uniref:ATP-binding cassette domain-containing protein n=1 Tax=Campylobacter concisus TaxID=199 RepID=UPI000D3D7E1F|nr:ABC transporter ATP-binding protein [Campylobacter concisus]